MSTEKTKITTGQSLQGFLTHVFEESIKSNLSQKALTEKEKQSSTVANSQGGGESSGGGLDDLFAGGGGEGEDEDSAPSDEENQTSKTMDDETEKLKRGEVKTKDIVSKLNDIRAGKSFRDDRVAKAMDDYINSLSRPERVALMAFLKGIGQIVTGEVPGKAAEDPSDHPSDVKMEKGDEESVRHVRPNVIKGSKPGPSGGSKSAEDTSSPAPITPRRR